MPDHLRQRGVELQRVSMAGPCKAPGSPTRTPESQIPPTRLAAAPDPGPQSHWAARAWAPRPQQQQQPPGPWGHYRPTQAASSMAPRPQRPWPQHDPQGHLSAVAPRRDNQIVGVERQNGRTLVMGNWGHRTRAHITQDEARRVLAVIGLEDDIEEFVGSKPAAKQVLVKMTSWRVVTEAVERLRAAEYFAPHAQGPIWGQRKRSDAESFRAPAPSPEGCRLGSGAKHTLGSTEVEPWHGRGRQRLPSSCGRSVRRLGSSRS